MNHEPYFTGIPKPNKYFSQEEGREIMNNQECCNAMPAQEEIKIKEKLEYITGCVIETNEIIQKIEDKLVGSYYQPQNGENPSPIPPEPKNINEVIDKINVITDKIRCVVHKIDELI